MCLCSLSSFAEHMPILHGPEHSEHSNDKGGVLVQERAQTIFIGYHIFIASSTIGLTILT